MKIVSNDPEDTEDETEELFPEILEEQARAIDALHLEDGMHLVSEDTPINKATLLDLELSKQVEYITILQKRRVAVRVQETKARSASTKASSNNKMSLANKLEKLAEKLAKLLKTIDTSLDKAEAVSDEIIMYRRAAGDIDD